MSIKKIETLSLEEASQNQKAYEQIKEKLLKSARKDLLETKQGRDSYLLSTCLASYIFQNPNLHYSFSVPRPEDQNTGAFNNNNVLTLIPADHTDKILIKNAIITAMAFSKDGSLLAATGVLPTKDLIKGQELKSILIFDTQTGSLLFQTPPLETNTEIRGLCFVETSPSTIILATLIVEPNTQQEAIRVWTLVVSEKISDEPIRSSAEFFNNLKKQFNNLKNRLTR